MTVKKIFRIGFAFFMVSLIIIYTSECAQAVTDGLRLCGTKVIPSLFPMFVASKLAVGILKNASLPRVFLRLWHRIFGVGGQCAFGFLFGLLGGYPLGASVISELYENKAISKTEAEKSLRFCNNSGPGFFLAALGTVVFQDLKTGIILYGIHIFSAILLGILSAGTPRGEDHFEPQSFVEKPFSSLFMDAIQDSCASLLKICGLILFFAVIIALLNAIGLFRIMANLPLIQSETEMIALLHGMIELTGGIFALQNTENAFIISAFLMGWGGLCVHFQAASLWKKAGLKPKGYYASKLLQAVISAGLAWAFQAADPRLVGFICIILILFLSILRFSRKYTGNPDRYAL